MILDDFLFLPRNREEACGELVLNKLLSDTRLLALFEVKPGEAVDQLLAMDEVRSLEFDRSDVEAAARTIQVELKMLRAPGGFERHMQIASELEVAPAISEMPLPLTLFQPSSAPTEVCPSTMCPLFAADGSPWSGAHNHQCRGSECVWWQAFGGSGCDAAANALDTLDQMEGAGAIVQAGPIRAKRQNRTTAKTFDCPRAGECRWQAQAEAEGKPLCPPRVALAKGLDPKACAF